MASKDQNSIEHGEDENVKFNRGLDLVIESLLKPDPHLRGCAYNQGCFNELIEIRDNIIEYSKTLRK